jgi:Fe-S oxidoreductase
VIKTSPRRNILDENTYRITNDDIWSCLSCGLCYIGCPQNVDYLNFVLQEREGRECDGCLTHKGINREINEIAVRLNPREIEKLDREYAYFPGCLEVHNLVFHDTEVDFKEIEAASVKLLSHLGIDAAVLKMKCCGHDALWQGNRELFEKLKEYNSDVIKKSGIKTLITSCAECYRTFSKDYELDVEVVHISELLRELEGIQDNTIVTLHDSCRLGRHMEVYDAPRDALLRAGSNLVEMKHHRENALCCGVSSMLNCNDHTKVLRIMRMQEAADTGAQALITTCPKCLAHFNCLASEEDAPEYPEVVDLTVFLARKLEAEE